MTRSGPRAPTLLALMLAGLSCAAPPSTASRSFEPNAAVSTRADVKLELRKATYEERMLTIDVAIVNLSGERLEIDAKGILLAEADLELPLAQIPQTPVPERLTIEGGGRLDVSLPFATRPEAATVLRVRAASRRNTGLELLELPIPEAPPLTEPT